MKTYEVCPVCKKDLIYSTYIRKPCVVLNEKNFSFVESICNHSDIADIGKNLPTHLYFQVASLYGDLLYEKVDFSGKSYSIIVNYVSHSTSLEYYSLEKSTEKILLKNRLIIWDFPDLTKAHNKIKTLALFL